VIHLGAPDAPAVMAILPRLMIDEALVGRCRAAGCRVYLEVPHVKPNKSHYETPEKLAALFKLVRTLDPDLKFFGLCIDTAHLWSCGANIASRAEAQDWFARLEAVHDVIPPAAIMFHLNDNRHSKGSGMDNHMELFGGAIWGEYTHDPASSGLAAVLDYARRFNIPTVLERKDPSKPKNPQDVLTRDYESLAQLDF